MRTALPSLAVAAVLLTAAAADAAPTCRNRDGETARCGAPGAMPVGWSAPPDRPAATPAPEPPEPGGGAIAGLIAVVGGLFALIALMPDFDGTRAGDWDRQEGDDERR